MKTLEKFKMILDRYLYYIQERQWDEETENPDSFDLNVFKKVFGDLDGTVPLQQIRHSLQPSIYNIYVKNSLGDYKGRPDQMNTKTVRHVGIKDFEADKERLLKSIQKARMFDSRPLDLQDDEPVIYSGSIDSGDGDGGEGGDGGAGTGGAGGA
jgi:hypothetical protein